MSKARAISPVSSYRLVAVYCNRIAWLATGLLKLADRHGGLLFPRSWLSTLALFFTVVIVIFVFFFQRSCFWLALSICNFSEIELMTSEDSIWILLCDIRTIAGYWPVTCTICQIVHQSAPLNLYGIMTQYSTVLWHFFSMYIIRLCRTYRCLHVLYFHVKPLLHDQSALVFQLS